MCKKNHRTWLDAHDTLVNSDVMKNAPADIDTTIIADWMFNHDKTVDEAAEFFRLNFQI